MNNFNIKRNDIIRITYSSGNTKDLVVDKVTDKCWYERYGSRRKFDEVDRLMANSGSVVKCEIIK